MGAEEAAAGEQELAGGLAEVFAGLRGDTVVNNISSGQLQDALDQALNTPLP